MVDSRLEMVCRKNDKMLINLVALACFLSNISQIPFLVSSGMTQKVNMPIWIVLLLYIFLKKRIRVFYSSIKIVFSMVLVIALLFVYSIVSDNAYFSSSVLQSLFISLFIFYLGTFVGDLFTDKDLRKISLSYVVSATIVAISIYIEYFSVGFDITSRQYAYASKNSISQIIFTAVVILMFIKFKKFRFLNLIRSLVILFEVMLLLLLKSRATIVGFAICIIYIIIGKQFNKKIKCMLIVFIITGTLFLVFNQDILKIIVNNILFAGRNVSSLDSLTSGRISIISEFPSLIEGHWITGIGALYFECFPLSCILQFGIIAGSIILGISYLPILKSMKYDRSNLYNCIFIIICIGYGINSFFEGLAPIGPGVKCYYMWLMYGILSRRHFENKCRVSKER